jgi:hypothetical protein
VADVYVVIPLDKVMDFHEELAVVVESQAKPFFLFLKREKGILKGEVSLYRWPPV